MAAKRTRVVAFLAPDHAVWLDREAERLGLSPSATLDRLVARAMASPGEEEERALLPLVRRAIREEVAAAMADVLAELRAGR